MRDSGTSGSEGKATVELAILVMQQQFLNLGGREIEYFGAENKGARGKDAAN